MPDIDRINAAIEKIKQPLDRRRREEPILRGGIQAAGLSEFIASMDRTQQALGDLQHSNLRSNQQAIQELNQLLQQGQSELETDFRNTLREDSDPVEPLHYITKNIPFPSLNLDNASKLRVINQYTVSSGGQKGAAGSAQRTANIYAEVRGPYVKTTLQNLAMASVQTVRKTDPNAIYRQGTSGISTYCTAMESLFIAEFENLSEIFGPAQRGHVHVQVCQQALTDFSKTLQDLHVHVKNNIITDCFLAYEIVDIVNRLSIRLDSRKFEVKQPIQQALNPIRDTAQQSFSRLLEDTRSRVQNLMTLPSDSAAVPVTSDTLTRLQTLTLYTHSLSAIMSTMPENSWRLTGPRPTSRPQDATSSVSSTPFNTYIADTIDELLTSLDNKSSALLRGSKSAQGVFMLNNLTLVDRALASHSALAAAMPDPARSRLDLWRKKAVALYTDAWKIAQAILMDQIRTSSSSSAPGSRLSGGGAPNDAAVLKSLSSKQRDEIKDKFKNFNATFDELVARHKGFRMEREVKAVLAMDLHRTIEPLYNKFWDRYHEIDKGKGKYVKYDKAQLAAVLGSLG